MAKNMHLHLKIGDIVKTSDEELYEVTCLNEKTFSCINYILRGSDSEITQQFNYNMPMIIFREYARNVPYN